jgi:ribonuclease HI
VAVSVIDCWTDGSGTTAGNPGGWAYVLETIHPETGEPYRKEGCGGVLDTTNNRMEMTACLMGLRALKPFTEGWLEKWVATSFRKKQNADLWLALREEVARHIVSWEWVPGHSKIVLNERCDLLAGQQRRLMLARSS